MKLGTFAIILLFGTSSFFLGLLSILAWQDPEIAKINLLSAKLILVALAFVMYGLFLASLWECKD